MSKLREKAKVERAKKVFEIKEYLKSGEDKFYQEFIETLYNNEFFNNLQDWEMENYENIKSNDSMFFTFKSKGITIGIYDFGSAKIIGFDPNNCFDKTSKCSVHVHFPMKKREYARFKTFFAGLLDEKSNTRREWEESAASSWYGSYATFGK